MGEIIKTRKNAGGRCLPTTRLRIATACTAISPMPCDGSVAHATANLGTNSTLIRRLEAKSGKQLTYFLSLCPTLPPLCDNIIFKHISSSTQLHPHSSFTPPQHQKWRPSPAACARLRRELSQDQLSQTLLDLRCKRFSCPKISRND
jgi:hypothetical protein